MPSKNRKAIKSYLLPNEYKEIEALAQKTGLSVSTFVKKVCLAQPVHSLEQQEFRLELLKLRADLGRLGGLLKMSLSADIIEPSEIRPILKELEARQTELKELVSRL